MTSAEYQALHRKKTPAKKPTASTGGDSLQVSECEKVAAMISIKGGIGEMVEFGSDKTGAEIFVTLPAGAKFKIIVQKIR